MAALYMARLCFRRQGEDTWDEAITQVIAKIERVLPRRILSRLPELLAAGDLGPDGPEGAHRLAVDDAGDFVDGSTTRWVHWAMWLFDWRLWSGRRKAGRVGGWPAAARSGKKASPGSPGPARRHAHPEGPLG